MPVYLQRRPGNSSRWKWSRVARETRSSRKLRTWHAPLSDCGHSFGEVICEASANFRSYLALSVESFTRVVRWLAGLRSRCENIYASVVRTSRVDGYVVGLSDGLSRSAILFWSFIEYMRYILVISRRNIYFYINLMQFSMLFDSIVTRFDSCNLNSVCR
jgi:hypothetical protein